MSPAEDLRERLAGFRRNGVPFADAWMLARARTLRHCVEPDEWRDALDWSRAAWEAAYEGGGPTSTSLLWEGRGVPLEPPRHCAFCGGDMTGRRPNALHCSDECKAAADRFRKRVQPTNDTRGFTKPRAENPRGYAEPVGALR